MQNFVIETKTSGFFRSFSCKEINFQ